MLPFSQIDVFTDELGFGNPVAVVHDAVGLDVETMQTFARWTNLSETTFLLPPTDPDADYRVRIFTGSRELPFAGHPTLGSARAWLAAGGQPHHLDQLIQECGAGLIRIRREGELLSFAAPPLLRGGPVEASELAEVCDALGVTADQVVDAQWGDNGPGWVMVLLRDADAVLALRPEGRLMGRFGDIGVIGPHLDPDPVGSGPAFELRAFFVQDGAALEDPVTGSLNAAAAGWLTATGRAPASYLAAQGTAIGRRGRIHIRRDGDDVWVGGHTVVAVRGQVDLPTR